MPPKKTEGASKAKATTTAGHSYQDMIKDAIINLKERNGSSRVALKKYVKANNKVNATDKMFDVLFNRALKTGVEKGEFAQPKGSSGGTKLAKKEPKPAAKPATAKPAKAAPKKTTTAKKPAAKKASTAAKPKKVAAKPTTAKKPAVKKAAAPKAKAAPKKAAAPKTAAAVVDKPAVLGKTKSGRVTKTTPNATKKAAPKKAAPKKPAAKKATPKKAAAPAA